MRNLWQCWEGALSDEHCQDIIDKYKDKDTSKATIFSERQQLSPDTRETDVVWIYEDPIMKLMENYIREANSSVFGYVIDYLPPIQFGKYDEGSFYTWHHDINWKRPEMYDRKLSISVQLSEPDSDYKGGNVEFNEVESPETFNRSRGSILVFPSYLLHRVTEVTEGIRYSLVGWMEGPRWR